MILRVGCFVRLVFFALLLVGHGNAFFRRISEGDGALNEFEEFLEWRRTRNEKRNNGIKIAEEDTADGRKIFDWKNDGAYDRGTERKFKAGGIDPPPVDQPALMGRYIVNQADWTAVATISSRKDIFSFPVANVVSVSDGPLGKGTGIPYMYITPLDYTAQDLALDDRATLLMSLAQGSYCKDKDMDPMDPRCARILLAGRIQKVTNSSSDYEVAKDAVFGRHPWLANMPADHHFFFAKLKIASIAVLDTFGGPKYVSIEDYMNPPSPKTPRRNTRHQQESHDIHWPQEKTILGESIERRIVYRV